jgi:hypothetical protein
MYWITFIGTQNGEYIVAENMKSAKWIFALKHGLNSISYVSARTVKN